MARLLTAAVLLTLAGLSGCSVRLIAPYDATLDTTMTQVQADAETFLIRLERASGTQNARFAANSEFYAKEEGTLRTLLLRAQAQPKSGIVADQIANIEKTFEVMERMHQRDGEWNAANLAGQRAILESEFRSFFVLELALKNRTGVAKVAAGTSSAGSSH